MIKSSFYEFNVATTGLFSAQANMQVASHNISNASRTGYSRQYTIQSAKTPISYYDGKGMYGTGSQVTSISQVRSVYLDNKYWDRRGTLGEYTAKNTQMSMVENTFNEMGDGTGIAGAMDNFFSSLQELGVDTSNLTIRNAFITEASSLAELINTIGLELEKQQKEINQEISMVVDRVNSIGVQIASLNEQIRRYELHGDNANDLRDARALLVDEISEYVNVEVKEIELNEDYNPADISTGKSNKQFVLQINGYEFVKGTDCNTLECVPRKVGEEKNPNDVAGLYDIKFATSAINFNMYSSTLTGTLKGLIDVRDGNNSKNVTSNNYAEDFEKTTSYKGIPHFQDKLNNLVRVLARAFNEGVDYEGKALNEVTGHIFGYDLNGNNGNLLFTYTANDGTTQNTVDPLDSSTYLDYSKMTYKNFTVNTDMIIDPSLFAASTDPTTGESDNNLVLGLLGLQKDNQVFAEGSVEDYVNGMAIEVGITVNQADKFEVMYTSTVTMIDTQRISVSGVDLNEEMVLMIKYQQQYNASAKLINTIDNIYNTLINGLGA